MPLIRQKRRISWTDSRTGLSISTNFPRFVDILSLDPICGYIKCHPGRPHNSMGNAGATECKILIKTIVSLFRCFALILKLAVSLFRCFTIFSRTAVSLFRCFTAKLFRCFTCFTQIFFFNLEFFFLSFQNNFDMINVN